LIACALLVPSAKILSTVAVFVAAAAWKYALIVVFFPWIYTMAFPQEHPWLRCGKVPAFYA